MTVIFKDGAFHDEDWTRVDGEDAIPAHGAVLVGLDRFLDAPEELLSRAEEWGVVIAPGDEVERLAPYLADIPLVAVAFPSFADGRGFSAARVLREHLGFDGDIRATGNYILDQVPMARRCGVTSFEISKPEVLKALKAGEWPEVTKYLQPVGTVDEIPVGTRPWVRVSLREVREAAE